MLVRRLRHCPIFRARNPEQQRYAIHSLKLVERTELFSAYEPVKKSNASFTLNYW